MQGRRLRTEGSRTRTAAGRSWVQRRAGVERGCRVASSERSVSSAPGLPFRLSMDDDDDGDDWIGRGRGQAAQQQTKSRNRAGQGRAACSGVAQHRRPQKRFRVITSAPALVGSLGGARSSRHQGGAVPGRDSGQMRSLLALSRTAWGRDWRDWSVLDPSPSLSLAIDLVASLTFATKKKNSSQPYSIAANRPEPGPTAGGLFWKLQL